MIVFCVKNDCGVEVFSTREKAVEYIKDVITEMDCVMEEDVQGGFFALSPYDMVMEAFYMVEKDVDSYKVTTIEKKDV